MASPLALYPFGQALEDAIVLVAAIAGSPDPAQLRGRTHDRVALRAAARYGEWTPPAL
jgi:hypothetical protein